MTEPQVHQDSSVQAPQPPHTQNKVAAYLGYAAALGAVAWVAVVILAAIQVGLVLAVIPDANMGRAATMPSNFFFLIMASMVTFAMGGSLSGGTESLGQLNKLLGSNAVNMNAYIPNLLGLVLFVCVLIFGGRFLERKLPAEKLSLIWGAALVSAVVPLILQSILGAIAASTLPSITSSLVTMLTRSFYIFGLLIAFLAALVGRAHVLQFVQPRWTVKVASVFPSLRAAATTVLLHVGILWAISLVVIAIYALTQQTSNTALILFPEPEAAMMLGLMGTLGIFNAYGPWGSVNVSIFNLPEAWQSALAVVVSIAVVCLIAGIWSRLMVPQSATGKVEMWTLPAVYLVFSIFATIIFTVEFSGSGLIRILLPVSEMSLRLIGFSWLTMALMGLIVDALGRFVPALGKVVPAALAQKLQHFTFSPVTAAALSAAPVTISQSPVQPTTAQPVVAPQAAPMPATVVPEPAVAEPEQATPAPAPAPAPAETESPSQVDPATSESPAQPEQPAQPAEPEQLVDEPALSESAADDAAAVAATEQLHVSQTAQMPVSASQPPAPSYPPAYAPAPQHGSYAPQSQPQPLAYMPPPAAATNPQTAKRVKFWGIVAGAVVLVIAVLLGVKSYLGSSVFSPHAEVEKYLQAIVDGDAEGATKMIAIPENLESSELLTNKVYKQVKNRPSRFEFGPETNNPDGSVVVSATVFTDNVPASVQFEVVPNGTKYAFFKSWKINSGSLVRGITVSSVSSSELSGAAMLDGVRLKATDRGTSYAAYPGTYQVSEDAQGKYLTSKLSDTDPIKVPLNRMGGASVASVIVRTVPTDETLKLVNSQLKAFTDECVKSQTAEAGKCDVDALYNDGMGYKWSVVRYPVVDSIDRLGMGGEGKLKVQYQHKSFMGSIDNQDEDKYLYLRYNIRFNGDQTPTVTIDR